MEVNLEVPGGNSFSIEIDPAETILDIKLKVQNSLHIPISLQTFIFNGQLLQDDLHVWESQLLQGSRIYLQFSANLAPSPVSDSDLPPQSQPTPELQLPPLPSCEYDPLWDPTPSWDPSLELIPTPYDLFGMQESSSSMQVMPMPMPNTPSQLQELEELPPPASPPVEPLHLPAPPPPPMMPNPPPPPPSKVTLKVKVPNSINRIPIEMELGETFLKLKEKLVEREDIGGVAVERIVFQSPTMRAELHDCQVLQNCFVAENPEIDVYLKPALPAAGARGAARRLKVKVRPMHSRQKLEIEVNSADRVSVLRPELDRLQLTRGFRLPQYGAYFFIHMQHEMHEEESFQWHDVRDGDLIETFDGYVTDAPPSRPRQRYT
ncbi:hypothetical protein VNO78_19310 [Psophocarpus tetragonolobus]|uniref:Ubiquitin-like domain-containing protein n=1 Tax=Psophocarpus tetragonolobus TaxID=3891 RepID=A0AAN9S9E0_PSOTE